MGKENTLDVDKLLQEFDMPITEPRAPAIPVGMPTEEEVNQEVEKLGSVENIIKKNLARVSRILDIAERELKQGNTSPKMFEAFSKVIDSATNAAQVLATQELTSVTLEQKDKLYNLKEWEIKEKLRLKQEGIQEGPQVNVNAIVTDRESLLDAILEGIKSGTSKNLSKNVVALENSDQEAFA